MSAFHLKANLCNGKDFPGLLTPSGGCPVAMVVGTILHAEQLRKSCARAHLCGDAPASSAVSLWMKEITGF